MSVSHLINIPILKKHRAIDGVTEEQFKKIAEQSTSRADLQKYYMQVFMQNNKFENKRWFDKTPQNIYGSAMIACQFPQAKFVHIVRNPMNVVASLRVGRVIKIESLIGACNNWNESAEIIHVLKRAYPTRVYELKYENLTDNFMPELENLLNFLDEDFKKDYFKKIKIKNTKYEYKKLFNTEELAQITQLCSHWSKEYDYDIK
jgi:hypothetical protein